MNAIPEDSEAVELEGLGGIQSVAPELSGLTRTSLTPLPEKGCKEEP